MTLISDRHVDQGFRSHAQRWRHPVLIGLLGALLLVTSGVTATQAATAATASATSTDSLWVGSGNNVGVCQSPTSTAALADCFTAPAGVWPQNTIQATATDGVNVYFATDFGGLSCPVSGAGTNCTQIAAGPWGGGVDGTSVNALAASDGQLWIGQEDGQIYRCPADLPYSSGSSAPSQCVLLDDAGNRAVSSLILANGTLYAGLPGAGVEAKKQGLLWTCDPQTANSCSTLDSPGNNFITTLAAGGGYLWAGLSNGILWRCDPTATNSCDNWDQAGWTINSVSYDGQGTIYAAIDAYKKRQNGVIWSCPTATENACDNVVSNLVVPGAVAAGPDNVFWSETQPSSAAPVVSSGRKAGSNAADNSPALSYGTSPFTAAASNTWANADALLYLPAGGPTGTGATSVRIRSTPRAVKRLRDICADRGNKPKVHLRIKGPHGTVVTRRSGLCRLRNTKVIYVPAFDLLDPGKALVKARFTGITKRPLKRSRTVKVEQDRTGRVTLRCPDHG